MVRTPGGKVTRVVAKLEAALDEYAQRLEHPPLRVDMSQYSQIDNQRMESSCASIRGHMENIQEALEIMKSLMEILGTEGVSFLTRPAEMRVNQE